MPSNRLAAPPGTQPWTPPASRLATSAAAASPFGARLDAFRAQLDVDVVSRDFWTLVRRQADAAVAASGPIELKVDASGTELSAMRKVEGRILACAFAYRLTTDAKYLAAARRELLSLAAAPAWGPGHFLDVGEASLGAGFGLHWLGDALLADDRDRIAAAIVRNALRPSLAVSDAPGSWVKGDFNWNPVCHAGLVVAALAVADREPALSKRIVDRAIECVPFAGVTYGPDGGFPEGPSYWAYGTTFYVICVEALRAARGGDDGGLAAIPGFLKTADFILHMCGPSGADFNYADYHERHGPEPVMAWFARELRRRDLFDASVAELRALAAADDVPFAESGRLLPFGLLWWDPTLAALPVAPRPLAWVAGGTHVGLAAFRSAWNDPRATYVAIKGGTPNGSHAHMDVGSFVLESDGVRWAIDLGTEDYNRMRAAKIDVWKYDQDGTRWTVFRCGPESHNVLRFDGALQASAGFAPARVDGANAANFDLSSIYPGATTSVARRVELSADRSVTIADAWTAGAKDVDVAFQWRTRADVAIAGDRVTLRQAGEASTLRVTSKSPFTITVEDVSQPRGPQDSANPGVKRIVIALKTAANAKGGLSVRATPGCGTFIQNNVSVNNGGSAIHSFKRHRVDVVNNTAYQSAATPQLAWGQVFFQRADDVTMTNNVLVAQPNQPVNTVSPDVSDKGNTNVVRANNVYFGGTKAILGENDVVADPMFVKASTDASEFDFTPTAGSPLIRHGKWGRLTPLTDIDGQPRPLDGPPTVGAIQR